MNAHGLTPLRRIAREAIAATVARQVELKYLHDVVRFPGFPAALAHTLRDLRLDRVPLSILRGTGRSGADLAASSIPTRPNCAASFSPITPSAWNSPSGAPAPCRLPPSSSSPSISIPPPNANSAISS